MNEGVFIATIKCKPHTKKPVEAEPCIDALRSILQSQFEMLKELLDDKTEGVHGLAAYDFELVSLEEKDGWLIAK